MSIELHEIHVASPEGRTLLRQLDAPDTRALQPLASRLQRLFSVGSSWAPGLHFIGAQVPQPSWLNSHSAGPSISLAGSGLEPHEALTSCLGEGAERLSSFHRACDATCTLTVAEAGERVLPSSLELVHERLRQAGGDAAAAPITWCRANDPSTAAETLVPASWAWRLPEADIMALPNVALSTGVAAGPTLPEACLRAQLELVERDAAALWWLGGRHGSHVPAHQPAGRAAAILLERLRRASDERHTVLLDVTTDLAVPAVAAVSCSPSGDDVTIGLSARLSLVEAAKSAILEMCQMELGLRLALVKLHQLGPASLTETDRNHVARAKGLNAKACDLLQPGGASPSRRCNDAELVAGNLLRPLAGAPSQMAVVNLTRRDIGVPVVRVIAPALQPMPGQHRTSRLAATIAEHGGGAKWTNGLSLM